MFGATVAVCSQGIEKPAGSDKNEGEGRTNLQDCDGGEPRKHLILAPHLGMLRKMAGDVRGRSVIWEIPDKRVFPDLIEKH